MEIYEATEYYIELRVKAELFAKAMDYDLIIVEGVFEFINSPSFKSFRFVVNPSEFDDDASRFLIDAFNNRI